MRFDPQSNFVPANHRPAAQSSGPSAVKSFLTFLLVLVLLAGVGAGCMWAATGPEWMETLAAKALGARSASASASPVLAAADLVAPSTAYFAEPESPAKIDRDAKAAFETGRGLLLQGQHAEAVPHLAEAIRLEPDFADAHYKLGLAYVGSRELEAARAERSALEQLDPNLASLLGNLIR